MPGSFSPRLQERVVRLATWMPCARAAAECAWFTGVAISAASTRRLTEAAGAAAVAAADVVLTDLERTAPVAPAGPAVQQLSADGAMAPVVGGEWAEVKTVAVGTVTTTTHADGRRQVRTDALASFSRLADAETFTRQATVELHRRAPATAGRVVAARSDGDGDGRVWLQGFTDYHRPDAVRVLDVPHAAEHRSAPGRAIWGEGSDTSRGWLTRSLHDLKHGEPADILEALCLLPAAAAPDPAGAERLRAAAVDYLAARWEQIQYATFLAADLPIGSGCIESANTLVMEARLKGSGMHWARAQVNPMLAFRTLACTDRWAEGWSQIVGRQRHQRHARRRTRHPRRPAPPAPITAPAPPPPPPAPPRPPSIVNGRPTATHPWKRPALAGGLAHNLPHAKS